MQMQYNCLALELVSHREINLKHFKVTIDATCQANIVIKITLNLN